MCYREYTGWPKSRFTEFTLALIIVFSVHEIVNLLGPILMLPCIGGNWGTKWQWGIGKTPSFLSCCGDWAELYRWGAGACPPCRRNWGSEGIFFLLPEWQRNPVDLCILFREIFSLHFLWLNKIGFGFKVCLLTNIRDGSPGPTRQWSVSLQVFMETICNCG